MLKKYCVFILVLITSIFCCAETQQQSTSMDMPSISPDGKKIAFKKTEGERNFLYVHSLEEDKGIMQLDFSDLQPVSIQFVNNEYIYLMLADSKHISGFLGMHVISTGFIVDLKTKKTHQAIIPGKDYIYPGQTGIGKIIGISADRNNLFIPCYIGTTEGILGGDILEPKYGLLKLDITSTKRPKIAFKGSTSSKDFFLDHNNNVLAEIRFSSNTKELSIEAVNGKKTKEIYKEKTSNPSKNFIGLMPDYESLVFAENNVESNSVDYYLLNIKSGNINKAEFNKKDVNILNIFKDDNRVIKGIAYMDQPVSYHFFDATLNSRVQSIVNYFPEHVVEIASATPDWKSIVVQVKGPKFASNYFLFKEGNEQPQHLTSSNPKSN